VPTAGKLIDEVKGGLQSYALDEEQSTTLAAPIGSMDLGFSVTASRGVATGISPGIVEIGSELLYCDVVNEDGTVSVVPWGRGYLSTTPVAHPINSRIVSQPSFPRAKILDAINQTLSRIFPDIFAVKQVELTTTTPIRTYAMPADCQSILYVRWQLPDASQSWTTVRRWRQNPGGGTQFGDTGITVDVADGMIPGRPIQFVYAAQPAPLVNETDDFSAVTGLGASIEDVVTLGAQVQLLPGLELSRLQMSTVEQQNRAQLVAPSAALTSTRFLELRFQTRLAEERKTLLLKYPPRLTMEWY
jgi:hypothetical protein